MFTRKSPLVCWKSDSTALMFLLYMNVWCMMSLSSLKSVVIMCPKCLTSCTLSSLTSFIKKVIYLLATNIFLLSESRGLMHLMQTHCNSLTYYLGRSHLDLKAWCCPRTQMTHKNGVLHDILCNFSSMTLAGYQYIQNNIGYNTPPCLTPLDTPNEYRARCEL